jgi:hypothetical protein
MITNLKVKLKSIFAVLLAFCVLTCTIHIEAMENELNKTEQIISTRVAPDNYVPTEDNE